MRTEEELYPVNLSLAGRLCLVVGGGRVAERKVCTLLKSGAKIRLVAPEILPELSSLPEVESIPRPFLPQDLLGVFLVFAATNNSQVNAEVALLARQGGQLVNVADDPVGSDFHLPATFRREQLTVSVGTAGGSPLFAVQLRDRLAGEYGDEWGLFAEVVAALRQKRLTEGAASAYNSAVVSNLFLSDLPSLLSTCNEEAINHLLKEATGAPITLADLGIHLRKGTT